MFINVEFRSELLQSFRLSSQAELPNKVVRHK